MSLSSKQIAIQLLNLLREETDMEHPLFLEELSERLEQRLGSTHSRKTLRRDLDELAQAGYPVAYNRGWYYRHEFSPAELDFLSESIAGSVGPTPEMKQRLLAKLGDFAGKTYVPPKASFPCYPGNGEYLSILHELEAAIRSGTQVDLFYGSYGEDGQLHNCLTKSGNPRRYTVSPYRILSMNGRLYLVANLQRYREAAHFRIDRILAVFPLSKPIRPVKDLRGDTDLLNPSYANHHPYMYTGKLHSYRIVLYKGAVNYVLDHFGSDAVIHRVSGRRLTALVRCDIKSMEYWLRRYEDKIGPVTVEDEDDDPDENE